jgi:hypothetical protein
MRNDRQVYFAGAFTGANTRWRIRPRGPWYRRLWRALFRPL